MTEPDMVMSLLDRLRRLGVSIALDDFGTGYSSLGYLTQLDIDYLKLDKSFISGMAQSRRAAAIVRSVIDLAAALQLKVIAEGIETAADWRQLVTEKCEFGQGYYFSTPVSAARFERLPELYRLT